ncbi:VanZ family protein [Peribacillus sp. SCS-37]|uniref:VanZ family protein n=1 Tax=Paraperibacillus esterisolvens TaxID=3115296 RepID=UPI003905BDF1
MRTKYLLPTILCCLFIFALTASRFATGESTLAFIQNHIMPDYNSAVALNAFLRKSAHVAVFGILAILTDFLLRRKSAVSWLLTTLYAAADEIHQMYMPGRTASIMDVLLDSLAALLFLTILQFLHPPKEKRADRS